MIHNFDTMRELVEKLNYYTKLYDEGNPAISDKEWDDMYFQLQELEKEFGVVLSNSPTTHISYTVKTSLEKVKHNHPMLSLQKTKSEEEVVNFLKGHDAIAMAKLDGLTCSLLYKDGKLISAETRGNGTVGEDVTHNMVWVKDLPLEIPIKDEVVIDGEIICTYKDFEQFQDKYANPRNFAAGSIRLLDSNECASRKLTFVAWDCIKGLNNYERLSDKLFALHNIGFTEAPNIPLFADMIDLKHIKHCNALIQEITQEPDFSFPIDGIVYKFDKCEYYQSLGATDHHFRGGIAFKFYDEIYESTLKEIEWSMGRTGVLTPIAVFDPIEIEGSIVSRASLHNVSIAKQILGSHPSTATKVKVYKANMIIPQIESAYTPDGWMAADINLWPLDCPVCGGHTEVINRDGIEIAVCTNPDCEGKLINKLDHFCGKKGMDIKGLSKATLEKLVDWNWVQNFNSIYDLYLHRNEWIKKPGFGTASVDKILAAIEKSRHTELWRVIAAAGIPEIGITASKTIANHYKTWQVFRSAILEGKDFSHLPDFGYIMNNNIHNYDFEIMDNVAARMVFQEDPNENKTQIFTGKQFCITGKVYKWNNRDSLKQWIENHGGKVTGSVTSKTDYLINNDTESTTTKNLTAKKLNIPILSETDFLALIDDLLAL